VSGHGSTSVNINSVNELLKLLTTENCDILLPKISVAVREKNVLIILYLFLGVFVFNHVADFIQHHNKEVAAYCCEIEELGELNELENRLRSFDFTGLEFFQFHAEFIRVFCSYVDRVSHLSHQRAFFPHALHVPIYLDKGVLIV
jgi:hypothetical protein